MKKITIITWIEGEKYYVRRFNKKKYVTSITMITINKLKAFDFITLEKAFYHLKRMGIGHCIEIIE